MTELYEKHFLYFYKQGFKETNHNIYKVQSKKIQSHFNPASVFNSEESFLLCPPGLYACSVFLWDRGSMLTFSANEI